MNRRLLCASLPLLWSACAAPATTEEKLVERLGWLWGHEATYLPPPSETAEEWRLASERSGVDFCLAPDLHGVVVVVVPDRLTSRDRIAVRLAQKPPAVWETSFCMALFGSDPPHRYKGELRVLDFYEDHALGTLVFRKPEQSIRIGDLADCKPPLNASSSGPGR